MKLLFLISIKLCLQYQSERIVKHGIRHNRYGNIQRFYCNDWGKWLSFNLGFEKMRATPQMIATAMQPYFTGESSRNVKQFLKLQGVKMTKSKKGINN
jgi:transposase-like protein